MRAGLLRHRVRIQRAVESRDSFGQISRDYQTVANAWVGIAPASSFERMAAGRVSPETTHLVTSRNITGLKAKDRLVFKGRSLELTGPALNLDERGREMALPCKEVEVPSNG